MHPLWNSPSRSVIVLRCVSALFHKVSDYPARVPSVSLTNCIHCGHIIPRNPHFIICCPADSYGPGVFRSVRKYICYSVYDVLGCPRWAVFIKFMDSRYVYGLFQAVPQISITLVCRVELELELHFLRYKFSEYRIFGFLWSVHHPS